MKWQIIWIVLLALMGHQATASTPSQIDPEALWSDAIGALARLEYQKASTQLSSFINKFPAQALDRDADFWLGVSELRMGHYKDAAKALRRSQSSNSKQIRHQAQIALAETYFRSREPDLGMLAARQVGDELKGKTEFSPSLRYEAWLYEILMWLELGRPQQAERELGKLNSEFPKLPQGLEPLGTYVRLRVATASCAPQPKKLGELTTVEWMNDRANCLIEQSNQWLKHLQSWPKANPVADATWARWSDLTLSDLGKNWRAWNEIADHPPKAGKPMSKAQAKTYADELRPMLQKVRDQRTAQLNEMIVEKKDSLGTSGLLYSLRLLEELQEKPRNGTL